jgi:septal ring factor EnvC (AmiA/AmiB activator)
MTWEEFFKLVAGGLFSFACLVVAYHTKAILTQLKELSTTATSLQLALNESTNQTSQLVAQVKRLDSENASLRRAHDALTRFLIRKGILSPPDPSTLNDL